MKIFIDDGSTNIKLAWLEDGDVKTLISPNSFKPEWSFSLLDDAAPANYEIDGEKFSFDPLSADAVVTTETRYQYSDVNVVAIQHALQQTGLKAQPVDVIVTLPISEYLDANNQKNKQNIERKKKNVMREVRVQGSDTFVIRSVSVLPESIPAGFSVLAGLEDDESLLIVDLGGTTLDVSHVRSKMTGITKTWCDPNIGVSLITSGVKEQMAVHANTRVSSFQADNIIVHRNEPDYLSRRIYNAEQRESIINVINERQKLLIKRVNDVISRCDVIVCAEMDEQWGYVGAKSRQRWLFYAYDRLRKTVVAHVFGERTMATLGRLMSLLSPFDVVIWMTDGWPLYESRLKGKLHVISKRYTQRIERHNLNLRQHLARLGRKSLSFSKSVELHDKVIGHYLNIKHYQ